MADPTPGSLLKFRLIITGLMLALTLASLDQNIVATALPSITADLGGLQHLSWVVTAFVVTSTVSAPLYGRLSDQYGRKPAFVVSISVFLVGSILCGLAANMTQLIGFRALQGLGAGGLIVLAQTVIGDLVSPRERGRYQGLFSAVFAGCSVAGPVMGGFITQYASWRWIFYINLPVGAAALALIVLNLRSGNSGPAARFDLPGVCLLVVGTASLLLMLSWGGSIYPWLSAEVLGLTVLSACAFGLLCLAEKRAAEPILLPALFGNRIFVVGASVIALSTMALFAAAVFLPLMFQLLMGVSPARAGLMVAPMMGGMIVSSFVGGRLVSLTGRYKRFPVFGLAVATLSYGALAWETRVSAKALPIELTLVFMGLGIGFVSPNLTTAIQSAVERRDIGGATSTAAFFRQLGGAIGVALAGAILAAHLTQLPSAQGSSGNGLPDFNKLSVAQRGLTLTAYHEGLSWAFGAGAIIAAIAFASVLFLPEKPLRSGPDNQGS